MVILDITSDNNTLEQKVYFSVRHNISYYVAEPSGKVKLSFSTTVMFLRRNNSCRRDADTKQEE